MGIMGASLLCIGSLKLLPFVAAYIGVQLTKGIELGKRIDWVKLTGIIKERCSSESTRLSILFVICLVTILYGTIYILTGSPLTPVRSELFRTILVPNDPIPGTNVAYWPKTIELGEIIELFNGNPGWYFLNDVSPFIGRVIAMLTVTGILYSVNRVLALFKGLSRGSVRNQDLDSIILFGAS